MRHQPLPVPLQHFSNLPDLVYRGSGEWSAACPQCGGSERGRHDVSDRFRLFDADGSGNARVWCRRCGYFEWADAQISEPPDPARIKAAEELRAQLAQQEARRLQARIMELRREAYYQGWHDAMSDRQRQLWREQGIADSLQDWFKLGYTDTYTLYTGDNPHTTAAMTIPHFDVGWQPVNVQYRLVDPPEGVGKYRYTAGLPAPLYLTEPDNEPTGAALLVEGAKKAIVTWAHIGSKLTVVAVPGKTPGAALLARLVDCDPVYVCLDPDAYVPTRTKDGKTVAPAVARVGELLGERARFVRLPAKPDDLFVDYDFRPDDFMRYVQQATRLV